MNKIDIPFNFQEGEVLLINKPLKWTSFDVVNKIRYILKSRLNFSKIKIGHAGTLDPLATGLLLVCTGKATKTIENLQDSIKEYTGTFYLGKTTPSFDRETDPNNEFEIESIEDCMIHEATKQFLGEIDQVPPIFSAKKINGKRLYEHARNGEEIEIPPNKVTIHEFEITKIEKPFINFRILCSKGTYIRSIANDFGAALNNGAYLHGLTRTKSGGYRLEDALSVEQFETLIFQLTSNKDK